MKLIMILVCAILPYMADTQAENTPTAEVPQVDITPASSAYNGYTFQVSYRYDKKRMTGQSAEVFIAITHKSGKKPQEEGYIQIWKDKRAVFSSALAQSTEARIPISLKKSINTKNAALFHFRIESEYIENSWFQIQVVQSNGSAEMDCILKLKEFIPQPPAVRPSSE